MKTHIYASTINPNDDLLVRSVSGELAEVKEEAEGIAARGFWHQPSGRRPPKFYPPSAIACVYLKLGEGDEV